MVLVGIFTKLPAGCVGGVRVVVPCLYNVIWSNTGADAGGGIACKCVSTSIQKHTEKMRKRDFIFVMFKEELVFEVFYYLSYKIAQK